MPLAARTVDTYREHLQDEADSAFLYRVLAQAEGDPARREVYLRLAAVEDKHTAVWEKILADEGVPARPRRPSLRARVLAEVARRFGPGLLSSLLLREEGREVKGYLALHRSSPSGTAQNAALRLARESAEHAETLRGLDGTSGEPWHQASSGGFLRNVVYGFNDGLTANFGLVAGVLGADVAPHVVLLSGISGMLADALSMGSSGYLAAKSEQEVYEHETAMEAAEIALMPEIEAEELALIYEAKGVERDAAQRMAAEVMADPGRALREKVREELGIGAQTTTPMREAWVTGVATAVGAFIPVAPFLLLSGPAAIWTAFAIAMLSHFAVGAARSFFTGRGVIRSGIDMFIVGLGVAAVGYLVGDLIARVL
ncbi:MAG: VIT1/CCC1 transporter family protein [Acidobacteriota bacterium]